MLVPRKLGYPQTISTKIMFLQSISEICTSMTLIYSTRCYSGSSSIPTLFIQKGSNCWFLVFSDIFIEHYPSKKLSLINGLSQMTPICLTINSTSLQVTFFLSLPLLDNLMKCILQNIHIGIISLNQGKHFPLSEDRKIPNNSPGNIEIFDHILRGLYSGGLIFGWHFVLVSSCQDL